MKYLGKITDDKDLVTKEWVESNTRSSTWRPSATDIGLGGGSTGQVLTKNASGYGWAAAAAGVNIVVSSTQPASGTLATGSFWYQVT